MALNVSQAPQAGQTGATQRTSEYAVVSLALGIAGVTVLPLMASVPAIILGMMAKKRISQDPSLKGGELATVGVILGIISLILGFLIVLWFFAAMCTVTTW